MLKNQIYAVKNSHLDSGKLLDVKQSQELSKLRLELASNLSSFEYIWKLEDFAKLQAESKYVFSEPFYSKKYGYKLRLLLNPNGVGDGEGTHLSIYLQVMKGESDAILKWPIEYSAKLSLLDQLERKDHHTEQLMQDFVKFKDGYAKPMTEDNKSLGIETFLSTDKLKPLYLVDDTIFIKLDLTVTS